MGTGVYLESRTALDAFLRPILHDIVAIVEHGRRMTVTVTDVLLALKRNGRCELSPPIPPPPLCHIHLLPVWYFLTQRPGIAAAVDTTGPVPAICLRCPVVCCLPVRT